MFDENEAQFSKAKDITLGCDLSTFSLEDLDERVVLLQEEIDRIKTERGKKEQGLSAAESFFKK